MFSQRVCFLNAFSRVLLVSLLLGTFVAQGKVPPKEFLNVPYGDAPGKANLLDIYLPEGHSPATKMVLYIHGGSWSRGSKEQFPQAFIALLRQNNYAVATMNYRLVREGTNQFPSQLDDVKKAIAFLSGQAGTYGYSGQELALIGASAGAHLALLYAYGHDPERHVKTVVDLFGPTDLADLLEKKGDGTGNNSTARFLGEFNPKAKIVRDASPINHLSKKTAVPTILFHGESDELVPVEQSKVLYDKLTALGVPTQLELYPNERHELSPRSLPDVAMKMIGWLVKMYPPA
ncbi:hypothetical protein GCM10027275_21950 [Rhabdobacter roseus]|uniref:Acetyl esterase/lipase n=1 Tax=Rhabdobacter roseus TaxID=1655419 RepID=A0A840TVZ6_9BACT|nr:alpha/beta hydrolase [Rhabdobacter roseus]MBB5284130.1 acetyl esterase/lipase [Rhabdobacter roseus]